MPWLGTLDLHFRRGGDRTLLHDRHDGPLRVLKTLHPEGPGVCHAVLVHPPGGIVGGDELHVAVTLDAGAHALVTTPGATRFYRSAGLLAVQTLHVHARAGARFEWLPLETLVHAGARAENRLTFDLDAGAEAIGWDVLALGLPASGRPFEALPGHCVQQIALGDAWLERGRIDAHDRRLLDSPLGWAGQRVMATLWFAAGAPIGHARREALLDAARAVLDGDAPGARAGATAPHDGVVVVRALAARVEPAMALLTAVWRQWRQAAWGLPACAPRVWRT